MGSGPFDQGGHASVDTGGGPLLNLGSHVVDMVLWFAGGDPVEVSGNINRLVGIGLDETAAFEVLFSSGAVAQCLVTQAAPRFVYAVDIHGRDGRVTLRGADFTQFEIEVPRQASAAYAHHAVVRPGSRGDHITTMVVPEMDEFALAVGEGEGLPPAITVTDARRVLQVLDPVVAADRGWSSVTIG